MLYAITQVNEDENNVINELNGIGIQLVKQFWRMIDNKNKLQNILGAIDWEISKIRVEQIETDNRRELQSNTRYVTLYGQLRTMRESR